MKNNERNIALSLIKKAISNGDLELISDKYIQYLKDPEFVKEIYSQIQNNELDEPLKYSEAEEKALYSKSEGIQKLDSNYKKKLTKAIRIENKAFEGKSVVFPVYHTIALAASFVGLLLALSILIPNNSKLKNSLANIQQENKAKSDSLYLQRRILNEKDSSLAEKELLIAQLSDEEKNKMTEFIPEIARLKLPGMKATENIKGGGGAEIIFYQSPKAFYNLNEPVLLGLYTSAQFKIVIRDNKSREVFSEIPAITDSKAIISFTPNHAGFYVYEISLPGDTALLFQSAFVVLPVQ